MAPTPLYQKSSTITCQAFGPKPKSTCNIPVLEEAMKACKDLKTPNCTQLENTRKQLEAACTQPTKQELQTVLGNLWTDASKNHHQPTATKLLLQSTEALVVQAALKGPGSGPQNFSTTIMNATVEVVHDNCSQDTLVLAVGKENLTIVCREVLNNTKTGKHVVAFIVYENGHQLLDGITNLPPKEKLNSNVVGGTTGKPGVTFNVPFNITLQHTWVGKELRCVSWQTAGTGGQWTTTGCKRVGGDTSHSICACTHFSTFAILMAIHPIKDSFALTVVTYVGMSVSLVCLFLAIITFLLCRSLWSVSVTLHLQLSICLFAAQVLFLVTTAMDPAYNKLACPITAGFLHYLFLACFAWMFLEGLHLFLTVRNLRVLNYTSASRFRKRYIYPVGYGTPAIIVAISAAVHPKGYSTQHHCWLSTDGGFIWSFIGPVCVIILANLIFFLTTLWTLRDKLSSLNADVTALKNTRLMTFKALAHICILGCTWGLGLLQAQGDNIVVAFIFTIINSLQGAFIFLVHCILNRQVTEQYQCWFRALARRAHPQEMPTTEIHVTYVTEAEKPHSHSTEGCTWEK
ncbi:putative adhesion G protein-coupled receptor E4P [Ciconia boyciana]|uniref:putative adhesion G protein-coupled receptor E4P n=1 Tax=Ciconia boyciana TaxID=52775 RepID=UPI003BA35D34